jgi:hypothetical protein
VPFTHLTGGFAEEPVVIPSEPAKQREGVVDGDLLVLGDDALGLFDHDA